MFPGPGGGGGVNVDVSFRAEHSWSPFLIDLTKSDSALPLQKEVSLAKVVSHLDILPTLWDEGVVEMSCEHSPITDSQYPRQPWISAFTYFLWEVFWLKMRVAFMYR